MPDRTSTMPTDGFSTLEFALKLTLLMGKFEV